jgi:4-amino-4-deoxy-L-arabinose transferase-like glycosyltransferase
MPDSNAKDSSSTPDPKTSTEAEFSIEVPVGGEVTLKIVPVRGDGQELDPQTNPIQLLIKFDPLTTQVLTEKSKPHPKYIAQASTALRDRFGLLQEKIRNSPVGMWIQRILSFLQKYTKQPDWVFFLFSIGIYLFTYFYRIDDFPIFFFTDEAVQTVLAADFLRDGLHDYGGTYLPTFFLNGSRYALSLSVYLQLLPTLLLPRSIIVTRAVAAIISSTSIVALSLSLKHVFKLRTWWIGVLLLGLTPTWFLHARTAFEYGLLVTCFAWSLYFYLRYRSGELPFLYPSILFAGLGFYSYNPGQVIIPGLVICLLIIDGRYHWKHRSTVLRGIALGLMLALPYIRFRMAHQIDTYHQLKILNSYWIAPISISEKLLRFLNEILIGLNPRYWFFPETQDLIRHVMKGYGHIQTVMLPFAALGVIFSLRSKDRRLSYVLLASLFATVLGGAVVAIGVTRVLPFIIPMTIFIAIGFDGVFRWVNTKIPAHLATTGLYLLLAGGNLLLLSDALINGPTWFTDYGLGGMQYGAKQVSAQIQSYIDLNPQGRVFLSPTWGNGIDVVKRFFFPDDAPVYLGSAASITDELMDIDENTLFVFTPDEYEDLSTDPKIGELHVQSILTYPDWTPGFYFFSMEYSDEALEIFEQDRIEKLKPRFGNAYLFDQNVQIEHPYFDSGEIHHIFDEDTYTFARVYESNPTLLKFSFPEETALSGISLTTGSMDFELEIRLYADAGADPVVYHQGYEGLPDDPTVQVEFTRGPDLIRKVEVEILSIRPANPVKIHIREITFY